MDTNKDPGQAPAYRTVAAGLGLLTSVVLLGAAGILVVDLLALPGAQPPVATHVEMPWLAILGRTMVTLTIIVALAIIAPLVGALCMFGLLRRYGKHLGPLIHLEYTGPPPQMAGPFVPALLGVEAAPAATAQPLNLGPSFEDERLRRAGQTGRMEAGVLRQLFEDNVKLQEKIGVAQP